MGEPVIRYVPRRDATPEGELNALTAVYRFLFERRAQRATDEEGRLEPEGVVDGILRKSQRRK